jgi:hypothetical protein
MRLLASCIIVTAGCLRPVISRSLWTIPFEMATNTSLLSHWTASGYPAVAAASIAEQSLQRVRSQLKLVSSMTVRELNRFAEDLGVDERKLEAAIGAEQQKDTFIALILEEVGQAEIQQVRSQFEAVLMTMTLRSLSMLAGEFGVTEPDLYSAKEEAALPHEALVKLMVVACGEPKHAEPKPHRFHMQPQEKTVGEILAGMAQPAQERRPRKRTGIDRDRLSLLRNRLASKMALASEPTPAVITNADGSAESSSMSENETSLADLLFDVIEKHQIEVLQPGKHFILGGLYTSSVGASR